MSHYLHGIDCVGLSDTAGKNTWNWVKSLFGGSSSSNDYAATAPVVTDTAARAFNMRVRPGFGNATLAQQRLVNSRANLAATQAQLHAGYAQGVTPELLAQVQAQLNPPVQPLDPTALLAQVQQQQQVVGAADAGSIAQGALQGARAGGQGQAVVVRVTDMNGLIAAQGAAASLANKLFPQTIANTQVFPTLAKQLNDGFKQNNVGAFIKADVVADGFKGSPNIPTDFWSGLVLGGGVAIGGWQLWTRVLGPLIFKRRR